MVVFCVHLNLFFLLRFANNIGGVGMSILPSQCQYDSGLPQPSYCDIGCICLFLLQRLLVDIATICYLYYSSICGMFG